MKVILVHDSGNTVLSIYLSLSLSHKMQNRKISCWYLLMTLSRVIAVFSWKLSRTPALTAEANTIINNIVSNTQGLLEEYYLPTSQSTEDCFYIPEPVPGQSVLFRGTCPSPTLMQNFNVAQVSWFLLHLEPKASELIRNLPRYFLFYFSWSSQFFNIVVKH